MMEEPESVVGGLEVILKAFPKAVGCICIEDNKPDCIAKMKEAIKGKERMEVKELKTKYPQGGERTLIYAVTGREINSTMLPADVGCVVDNVETVTSVYKAVILGQPVISRNVTVTGDGIRTPKNFSVLTGTDLSELVDAAGGLKEKIAKAISGGPMMGFALYDLHIPCTKTTSRFPLQFLIQTNVSGRKQILLLLRFSVLQAHDHLFLRSAWPELRCAEKQELPDLPSADTSRQDSFLTNLCRHKDGYHP